MVAFVLMLVITVTALPALRRRSYNTFYYTHITCNVVIFVTASIHASTDFYYLIPGLALWMLDWILALFRADTGMGRKVDATLTKVREGWYKVTLPIPLSSLKSEKTSSNAERVLDHPTMRNPIYTYYLNFPPVSKFQNHPLTAASVGSRNPGPTFLFQKSGSSSYRKQERIEKESTWNLGRLVDAAGKEGESREIECRVEGPYAAIKSGHRTADEVVGMVGGTGLTGAYSLALWWLECRTSERKSHFTLLWAVQDRRSTQFREWKELVHLTEEADNMTIKVHELHVSTEDGRLDADDFLRTKFWAAEKCPKQSTWVYVSGPQGLLNDKGDACVGIGRELKHESTNSSA